MLQRKKWLKGLLVLILVHANSLVALSVAQHSDAGSLSTFQQVRMQVRTVTLPGGVKDRQIVGLILREMEGESPLDPDIESVTTSENVEEVTPPDVTVALAVVGPALNYPNPCRLGAQGTTIGYYLSKDADIEIRIYDPFFHEIYRESFLLGQNGGRGGSNSENYNRVSVTADKLRTSNVPAGIYYFALLSEGKLLAKGKIAALP